MTSGNGARPVVHLGYGDHACGKSGGKGTMSVSKVTCEACKDTRAYSWMGGK